MDLEYMVGAFAAVFAIVNPIGNIPFFQAVTEGYAPVTKHHVVIKVCVVTTATLLIFGLFGQVIFDLYNITIPAFKIAGGILLFSIAFSMLQGQKSRTKLNEEEKEEALLKEAVGIVPLGIPMFAGPGAITTVMILVSDAAVDGDTTFQMVSVVVAIVATVMVSYVLLTYSDRVFAFMGKSGAMAFSRIMGLLLAAVAVNFILTGVAEAIPLYGLLL